MFVRDVDVAARIVVPSSTEGGRMIRIEDRADDSHVSNAWDIKTSTKSFTVYAQVSHRHVAGFHLAVHSPYPRGMNERMPSAHILHE